MLQAKRSSTKAWVTARTLKQSSIFSASFLKLS
nr:MAG TPA: hypothetical protein [Caudoviricetes sp.]